MGIYGAPPGRYGITVRDGYLTADPRIPADRLEENDYCDAADTSPVELPFADTLTIDNPYEVDWIKLDAPRNVRGFERDGHRANGRPTIRFQRL